MKRIRKKNAKNKNETANIRKRGGRINPVVLVKKEEDKTGKLNPKSP